MTLEDMLKPKPLDYYQAMLRSRENWYETVAIDLDEAQAAAILKAHDHGIANLEPGEVALLDQVMSKLKEEIWP